MKSRVTFQLSGPVCNCVCNAIVETPQFCNNSVIVSKAARYVRKGTKLRPSVMRDHVLTPVKIEKDI